MIFITGATGTVGPRLVASLLDRGEGVRAISRDAANARSLLGDAVEVAEGDLGSAESVRAALGDADRVFMLAPSAVEPGDQLRHDRNVIAAARDAGVRRVVKLSARGADERSPMQYARLHREGEKELEASGVAFTILRATGFMQSFFRMLSGDSIYTCAGDGRVALVDVRDVAAVAAAALTEDGHEGRTYTLTGPDALSYDDAAAMASAATRRTIRHVRVPSEAVVEGMVGAGVPAWLAQDLAAQFGVFANRDDEVSGDVEAVTGRKPRSLDAVAADELVAAA